MLRTVASFCLGLLFATGQARAETADLIVHHAKVAAVDERFSLHEAIAVREGRVLRLGTNAEILALKGESTRVIDAGGKLVLPGLIDSHLHPTDAAIHEWDHEIPVMETLQDVLDYLAARAKVVPKGEWIQLSQVFITRLREQRYPTRAELDRAAPEHPVVFATGPDASVNSLALAISGIDKNFRESGPGRVERDPTTGEPTGILRSGARYLKTRPAGKTPSEEVRVARLLQLFRDYHSVGLTAGADRSAEAEEVDRFRALRDSGRLTFRLAVSRHVTTDGALDGILTKIREIGQDPLCRPDPWLRVVGVKTFLDGGMLTGSAYMREPWGVSRIYSIRDPEYRGLLYIPRERLLPIVRAAVEAKLQFTAHSVGDGAVHTLLDVYEELAKTHDLRGTRPCITHCNFMSREAIDQMARLGVVADVQPAWLYLDTRTLTAQFGYERLRYFQPLATLFRQGVTVGGGSDHMQKIGSLRSVNPYNPFLAMWVALTRRARWHEGQLHPEEALTREQVIRFYTSNNAHLLFWEDQLGTLAAGKWADFIVLDRDLLTCPVDDIRETQVRFTFVGGKQVHPLP